ncbi:hypothetical protein GCM10010449_71830 [Streptomyces rectiviolaceus]|uniref:Lipoprotein n=1 Tax=Streptomyces rectiviolaceus TaxID=332591 RepID=A0ABP6NAL0_9ACTN
MTGRARAHRFVAAALAAGVLAPALLTGCAQSVDPIERLGRKAAEKVPSRKPGVSPSCAPPAGAPKTGRHMATETEPPTPGKRCPEGHEATPVPPKRTPPG